MIDTVLVDMGETLVSFKPKYHQNVAILLKEFGYDVEERKVFRAVYKVLGNHHYPHPQFGGFHSRTSGTSSWNLACIQNLT